MQQQRRFFSWVLDHPRRVLAIFALLTVAAASQLVHFDIAADINLLIPHDKVYAHDQEIRETFGVQDYVLLGVVREEGVLNAKSLRYAERLIDEVEAIPGVEQVRSLFSEDNITNHDAGLTIQPFLPEINEATISETTTAIRSFPAVQGVLASEDLTSLALLVEISNDADKSVTCERIQAIVDSNPGPQGEEVHLSGMPVFEGVLGDYILRDIMLMNPLLAIILAVVLFIAYRSWLLVICSLVEIAVVTIWTIGLMAACGVAFHTIHVALPVVVMALAVTDEIHIFSRYRVHLRDADPNASARHTIIASMGSIWRPVLLTSITTACGFIGFLTTSAAPLRQFGLFAAFGVMSAMVFSLMVTPIALRRFASSVNPAPARRQQAGSFGGFGAAIYRRRVVVATCIVLGILLASEGVSRVYTQDSWITNFSTTSDVRQSYDLLVDKFDGVRLLQVELDAGEADGVLEPEFLRGVQRFQDDLERSDVVGGSLSMAQVVEKMNLELSGVSQIPDSRALNAQFMLLLGGSSYEDLWDSDLQKTRVVVFAKKGDYLSGVQLYSHLFGALDRNLPNVEAKLGGDFALGLHWIELLGPNQVRSMLASLALVLLTSSILLQSARKGIIVTIPVAVAVLFHFGFFGFWGLSLDVTRSIFSSIVLGVGVDYAIHLEDSYTSLNKSMSATKAVREAFAETGEAITWSSVVIVSAFLVLLFSKMPPTQELGSTVSLGIMASLLASFLVVPVLLPRNAKHAGDEP